MNSRVLGVKSAELNLSIMELASQGMKSREIGEELGYHARMVAARVTRMRKKNSIPSAIECRSDRSTRAKLRNLCQNYDKNLGSMTRVMECLTEDQVIWMYRETPKGMMVADLVVALIRDAYAEDTGNG